MVDDTTGTADTQSSSDESAPPSTLDPNRSIAQQSLSEGEEMVECPNCHNQRRAFLIVDGKCDSCRVKDQQAVFPAVSLGWPEVRQRRTRLLEQSDFTHVSDFPEDRRAPFTDWRQSLRDITTTPDPLEAWRALDLLEATRPST